MKTTIEKLLSLGIVTASKKSGDKFRRFDIAEDSYLIDVSTSDYKKIVCIFEDETGIKVVDQDDDCFFLKDCTLVHGKEI